MADVENIRIQRAKGTATILAIGTANTPTCFFQDDYPDFYFRVTNSDHMTQLKDKFKLICEKSMIRKRYQFPTEEILKQNPKIGTCSATCLDARQEILVKEIPKLGHQAAVKALKEWGQPLSKITHLIFCTISGVDAPGADYQLMKLLGLEATVNRFMLYHQGCFVGGTSLRLAKDLVENKAGARALVVCCEMAFVGLMAPDEARFDSMVGQALFSDGASSVVVGADPDPTTERQLFQIVSAAQSTIPDTQNDIKGRLGETGLNHSLSRNISSHVGENIRECFRRAVSLVGIQDPNSLFYCVHPGGPAVLLTIEENLGLGEGKLSASWHVLREYGNMGGASVLFVLEELRKRSMEEGKRTTGDGLDWGLLVAFGPGITIETILLHSSPLVAAAAES